MTPQDIRVRKAIIDLNITDARLVLDFHQRQLDELQEKCTHPDKYDSSHGWYSYGCPDCGKIW